MVKNNKNYKKVILVCVLLAILIVLAGFLAYSRNSSPTASKQSAGSSKITTNNDTLSNDKNGDTLQQSSNKYPTGDTNSRNQSVSVIKPSGTFVNNHNPRMSDSMLSICETTPNITCQINFTKNGTKHSLPAQTTDRTGNAVWSWTPKSLGLTSGTWQITATATSGTKSVTETDPIALEVQ